MTEESNKELKDNGLKSSHSLDLKQKLVYYYRELHKYPELSFKEFKTTQAIRQWLEEEGIDILDFPLNVGVIAEIRGNLPGPTLALRADIDALPIQEDSGIDYASQNEGVMHACGHDFHMASILGAALLLKEHRAELKGTVRFIFQPGEEATNGAQVTIETGVLEGVDAIFGFHNKPDLPVGTVGIKSGALMASVDRFEIEVIGVGGHAGIPHNVIDPIVTASQIVTTLQTIVSRNLSPFSNVVISVTRFQAGNTWNVIPERAVLEGTVRTFQEEARALVPELMKRAVEGIAAAYGAKVSFRWFPSLPCVDNDPQFTSLLKETAEELGYKVVEAEPIPGGEDFAAYQKIIPGYFVWIGVEGTKEWHHPQYNLKEEALSVGANYFAHLALKIGAEWPKNKK
ncbi:amidohydrolase [Desulfitobacterium sp. Sab5]|uniref:amidohydrolase n=1 Tax=Desulfitobacterium nosdiversum TaxID=3375356 RepID=UPI003CE79BA9